MPRRTVLSLEQATALPYATQRFVQLGWRVIRIEAVGGPGETQPGDPNRYVGKRVIDESAIRCSWRPMSRRRRWPRHGEHTRQVLAEIGLGAGEIDRLFADGAVA